MEPMKSCNTANLKILAYSTITIDYEIKLLSVLLNVTLEVKLSTLRKETLAPLLTATTKTITASFGSHTCTETVLLLANTL